MSIRDESASEKLLKASQGALLQELGGTGLEQWSGIVSEEFLNQLRDRLGLKVFREMSSNDAVVGAMLYGLEMLMRPVQWTVEPFHDPDEQPTDADKLNAKFVDEALNDMSHSWGSFLGEWMAAPVYGFAPFEIVWKKRRGWKADPDLRSKYDDGRLGISKLAIRHPDTLDRWVFTDDSGRVEAMIQRPPPTFRTVTIPWEKLLLFTTMQRKGNPQGTSLLRRAFVAWYRKKKVEEIESIGIERELAGLPKFETPPEWWLDDASSEEKALLAMVKKIGRRVKADEQAVIVMPRILDEGGNQLLTFELVTTGGRRAIDTGATKEYYSRQIAMTILADVILIGHEKVGSNALASTKTNLFAAGIGALLDGIEDPLNDHLIPRLMVLNGLPPERSPSIRHGDIETPDLGVLGKYVSDLGGAGMELFPTEDGELERELLRAANLPESQAAHMTELFSEEEERRRAAADALAQAGEQAPTFGEGGEEEEEA